jgi:hypothetical protein
VELEALFEQFKALATSKNGIDKDTFERCLGPLGVETNLITDRIFKFFDQGAACLLFLSVLLHARADQRDAHRVCTLDDRWKWNDRLLGAGVWLVGAVQGNTRREDQMYERSLAHPLLFGESSLY